MSRLATRLQLESIADAFALVGPARVEFPASKYEALRELATSSDDFTAELACERGVYVERTTVHIRVGGIEFVAVKTEPTVMREVARGA